jgi:hypothetical protein
MKELVGKKIRLIKMVYHDPVAPGTTGKVVRVDAIGLMHIMWERRKGKGLCIDPEVDKFEVV